jgi:hypothetical protein
MFCASIFNLRGLISLEMISMPLALTEKWRERGGIVGQLRRDSGGRRVAGTKWNYSTTSINFNI